MVRINALTSSVSQNTREWFLQSPRKSVRVNHRKVNKEKPDLTAYIQEFMDWGKYLNSLSYVVECLELLKLFFPWRKRFLHGIF